MIRKSTLGDVDQPESSMSDEIDPMLNRIPEHPQPDLNLSLGPSPSPSPSPSPPTPPSPLEQPPQFPPPQPNNSPHFHPFYHPEPQAAAAAAAPVPRRRNRRNPTQGKSATIEPPFPWATDRRAQIHTLKYLLDGGINTVSGDVQCKQCERQYQIEYNLQEKFSEVGRYMAENKKNMYHRAPPHWMNPTLPKCRYCHQENSVKPKISEKKKSINWLFLLIGQMVGCCTLEQLKYFCKHSGYHRTGAKNRLLFLTYLGLCDQVDPSGPFKLS